MADDPDHQVQERRCRQWPKQLLQGFSSPDSYGLVDRAHPGHALSATITAAWGVSLVLFVQIATIWVTLHGSQAHHGLRQVTSAILVVTAIVAIPNLFISHDLAGGVMAVTVGLLYVVAPASIDITSGVTPKQFIRREWFVGIALLTGTVWTWSSGRARVPGGRPGSRLWPGFSVRVAGLYRGWEEPLAKEPKGVVIQQAGRPLLGRKLKGTSQRESRDFGLLVEDQPRGP